jgi:hypothetical protein
VLERVGSSRPRDAPEPVRVTSGFYVSPAAEGTGPSRAYSIIVRIDVGAHPIAKLRAKAQRALDQLELHAQR